MASKNVNLKVGLFVVISMALMLFALFFWGVAKYMGETKTYVTYFNEDVTGINKDTIVKYRGVTIGRIEKIGLAPDGKLIEVKLVLRSDFSVTTNQYAQIMSSGITGIKYLGIEYSTNEVRRLKLDFTPEYQVIASRKTPSITDVIVEFQKQMKSVNLGVISAGMTQALYQINKVFSDENWAPIFSNIYEISHDAKLFTKILRKYIETGQLTNIIDNSLDITFKLKNIVNKLDAKQTEILLNNLNELIESLNNSAFIMENNLQPIIINLKQTLNNLRDFTEALKERPSQTLFSKPPEKK